jgi:hypothetical protein
MRFNDIVEGQLHRYDIYNSNIFEDRLQKTMNFNIKCTNNEAEQCGNCGECCCCGGCEQCIVCEYIYNDTITERLIDIFINFLSEEYEIHKSELFYYGSDYENNPCVIRTDGMSILGIYFLLDNDILSNIPTKFTYFDIVDFQKDDYEPKLYISEYDDEKVELEILIHESLFLEEHHTELGRKNGLIKFRHNNSYRNVKSARSSIAPQTQLLEVH